MTDIPEINVDTNAIISEATKMNARAYEEAARGLKEFVSRY